MNFFTLKIYLSACLILMVAFGHSQTDVLTQHNDVNRTGWNPNETILNTSNVTPTNFGLLYKYTVDDQIFAQPLIVSGINVTDPITHTQVARNLLIVVTVKNTMYAFDADDGTLDPYWQINFTPAGEIPPNNQDIHAGLCGFTYTDFTQAANGLGQDGSFGTVGTPVIDKATNTIYFVSRYRDLNVDNALPGSPGHTFDAQWSSAGFFQQVHALDLSTGTDKFGSPVLINPVTTFVMGVGTDHNANNEIHFDPRRENQRGGLLLSNGIVYIPFAGHCDMDNYHGWLLGYKADDLSQQLVRYNATPNNERGGIWMSGAGPAADAAGNIYFAVGNGNTSSTSTSPQNMALSVVNTKPDLINQTLTNVSWYKSSPATYNAWNQSDLDFGTGVVLIPGTNMLVTAHKSGKLMVMPQNIPLPGGAFNETNPNFHAYDLGAGGNAQSHSSLTYFGGAITKYIYQFSENTHVMAFPVNTATGTLGTAIQNTSVPVNGVMEGGYSSVSSNGTDPASGILWVTQLTGTTLGTIHALKADNITQELWNSDQNPADKLGNYAKMSPPTIANGKVYVPTFTNTLNVYGLLTGNSRCVTNVALNKTYGDLPNPNTIPGVLAADAFDNNIITRWAIGGPVPQYLYVDLGARFDICKVSVHWNSVNGVFSDYAISFTVDISEDGIQWTTINSVTGNFFTANPALNEFNEHTTGRFVRVYISQGGAAGTSISEFQVFGSPANNCVSPALANMTATNITENTATLGWNPVPGITKYIVRYKPGFVSSFVTRNVTDISGSGNPLSINIIGLTCGFAYDFNIQSDCGGGQLSNPNVLPFNTSACSSPCLNLTRWNSADLGDVQVAGKTCYTGVTEQDKTWTITGAGTGLGANGDIFQINYSDLNTDEEFIASIESQSTLPASNQAGILMRDSLTDISRFIFIGKTGGNQLVLIYRTTPGGPATTSFAPNPNNANFFRLLKAGTTYTAFYGTSGTGPWTQMGPTAINLNFGAATIKVGMGVSSTNATTTSTASFKFTDGSVLPVQLLNFTATNEQNQYVALGWQTAMEVHSDHFDVERSTDGEHFEKIISVKAAGNSNVVLSYSSADNEPVKGFNFYRLKQVDSDGRFNYSPVEKVKFGIGVAPLIYPNPVKSVFTAVSGAELIREIVIYNVQGRAVQFVMGNSTEADMKVNISLLPKGVYFLKVKTDSQNYQFKIVHD